MSLLSCKRFAERHTRSLDEPLKGWDRFAYYFHYLLCYVCRRFSQQMSYLDKLLKIVGRANPVAENTPESKSENSGLSTTCSLRIKEKLKEPPSE